MVGEGAGLAEAVAVAVSLGVAEAVADAVAVGVAVPLPGGRAVPLNSPLADGDTEPPAVGFPEPVQAVIPKDSTITTMTLAARMPTQCLFPSPARGNLDNG